MRQWPPLLDPDNVTDVMLILFVMRIVLLGAPHGLLHYRLREPALPAHDGRFILLVAHHYALQHALGHIDHSALLFAAPARFCAATVLMRAMSRRACRTRAVFSSCPVARWKRRFKRCFFGFRASSSIWDT